jgi:nucleoside-diphosphate-sugar epimerase
VPDLEGLPVLVTGGAGFIGANLVRGLIAEGARVSVLIRPTTDLGRLQEVRSQIILYSVDGWGEGGLEDALSRTSPDIVFHLAFPSGHPTDAHGRRRMLEDGVLATASLLEAVCRAGISRLVHFGSSMEYGPRRRAISETEALKPVSFRGAAKAACSLLCDQYGREHRVPVVILRPFHVYGYFEPPSRLIPAALLSAMLGSPFPIPEREFRRDFVFVEDIVEATVRACHASLPHGTVINLGSGRGLGIKSVIELVRSVTGREIRTVLGAYPARPWDTDRWAADTSLAGKHLAWSPRHTLRAGIEKTWGWLMENPDAYGPQAEP